MRIRSIKPEFWRSADVMALSREQRLLFVGLWSYVDDNGVGRDDLALLVADLFPGDALADSIGTVEYVKRGLHAIAGRGLIVRYVVRGRHFFKVTTWAEHQRISHPNPPRYPEPEDAQIEVALTGIDDLLRSVSGEAPETLSRGAGEQGSRGAGEQGKRASRLPASWQPPKGIEEWLSTNAPSIQLDTEAAMFKDHWLGASGPSAIKSEWNRAFYNWCRRQHGWNVERGWRPPVDPADEWRHR